MGKKSCQSLRYSVYYAQKKDNNNLTKGKRIKYGYGLVDEEKIKKEIIPYLNEKQINSPVLIYQWYSIDKPKNKISNIISESGNRFKSSTQKEETRSKDWLINGNRKIIKL